jgi:hypothetical protein
MSLKPVGPFARWKAMKGFTLLGAAALTLAGCGGRDPVADNLNEAGNVTAVVNSANATARAATNASQSAAERDNPRPPDPTVAAGRGGIPQALQGRWGMTPADCTSTRGDAKGLLTITRDQLQFYESRAIPKAKVQTGGTSISGDFTFTGEGQDWTRYETLQLQDGKLVRTESKPMASYTYARCS